MPATAVGQRRAGRAPRARSRRAAETAAAAGRGAGRRCCRPAPGWPAPRASSARWAVGQPAVSGAGNGGIQHDDPQPVDHGPAGRARLRRRPSRLRWNAVRTSWLPVAKIDRPAERRPTAAAQPTVGVRVAGVGEVAGHHHGVEPPAVAPRRSAARRPPGPGRRRRRAPRCTGLPPRSGGCRTGARYVAPGAAVPSRRGSASRLNWCSSGSVSRFVSSVSSQPASAGSRPAQVTARQIGRPRRRVATRTGRSARWCSRRRGRRRATRPGRVDRAPRPAACAELGCSGRSRSTQRRPDRRARAHPAPRRWPGRPRSATDSRRRPATTASSSSSPSTRIEDPGDGGQVAPGRRRARSMSRRCKPAARRQQLDRLVAVSAAAQSTAGRAAAPACPPGNPACRR